MVMNISSVSSVLPSFGAKASKGTKAPVLTGLDYKNQDTFELSKKDVRKINQSIREDSEDKNDVLNTLITARIPKTIERAEEFLAEHPELSKDDVIQDLLLEITNASRNYTPRTGSSFNTYCTHIEDKFFESLLNSQETIEEEPLLDYIDTPDFRPYRQEEFEAKKRNEIKEAVYNLPTFDNIAVAQYVGLPIKKEPEGFTITEVRHKGTLAEAGKELDVSQRDLKKYAADGIKKIMLTDEGKGVMKKYNSMPDENADNPFFLIDELES